MDGKQGFELGEPAYKDLTPVTARIAWKRTTAATHPFSDGGARPI